MLPLCSALLLQCHAATSHSRRACADLTAQNAGRTIGRTLLEQQRLFNQIIPVCTRPHSTSPFTVLPRNLRGFWTPCESLPYRYGCGCALASFCLKSRTQHAIHKRRGEVSLFYRWSHRTSIHPFNGYDSLGDPLPSERPGHCCLMSVKSSMELSRVAADLQAQLTSSRTQAASLSDCSLQGVSQKILL